MYGEVSDWFLEARIPVERLELLASSGAITRVATVTEAIPPDQLLQVNAAASPLQTSILDTIGVRAWHDEGFTGEGQKIGILDVFGQSYYDDAISQGRLPLIEGSFCQSFGRSCNVFSANQLHGVGVAEIIHQVAPDAELYFASTRTTADLAAALDWFDQQGLSLIHI